MRLVFGNAYKAYDAPAILMAVENHNETRAHFNTWKAAQARAQGGAFSWGNVSESQIRQLSEEMFDRAKVPAAARAEYWQQFNGFVGQLNKSTGRTP